MTGLALTRDPDSWVLGILEEKKKVLLTPESIGAGPLIVILRFPHTYGLLLRSA